MCQEVMDTRSKHIKTDSLRKTMKPGSRLKWKLPRVSTEGDAAFKKCLTGSVRTFRKCLRREQRRAQLAKLAKALGKIGKTAKKASVCEEVPSAACMLPQPSGAMAPPNTTQYLMGNVYDDLKTNYTQTVSHVTSPHHDSEYVSPSVCDASDSDYDSCLAFQQRDFEEVFDLYW
ncbi:Protein HEXIM2 [Dissostichus eleginoides]|uniref:Protein HEXIM2 n=1 Tax=Dissostichus eleginoides TaxID=100907 RepID=A0AAD9CQZ7_DISEL|nr:Protein HEXIM2 [Dissostichus eleginoides]